MHSSNIDQTINNLERVGGLCKSLLYSFVVAKRTKVQEKKSIINTLFFQIKHLIIQ